MLFGRLQLVWWWRWAFGSGVWPRERPFVIFRYVNVGPVEVRWFCRGV